MHVGLVRLGGTKMSKSLGNLVFVSDLLKDWEPAVIRLAIIGQHYRSAWDWEDRLLVRGRGPPRRRGSAAGPGEAALDEVRAALDDDLDTPAAIAAIDEAAASGAGVSSAAAALLGISL